MCTVTIIPQGENDFVLTSNRDEAPSRISLVPEFYNVKGTRLLFPKDELSGGTWIGLSEKNRLICVLNGGFENHKRKAVYRISRGVVAKDFMVTESVLKTIATYNFEGIEPFTIIIADWNDTLKFYELVWDGNKKYFTELPLEPRIWSSSTLYNTQMRQERLQWFETFKIENVLTSSSALKFHKTAGKGNDEYGVVMNRGFVKTTSITQVKKQDDVIEMRYENIEDELVTTKTLNIPEIVNE